MKPAINRIAVKDTCGRMRVLPPVDYPNKTRQFESTSVPCERTGVPDRQRRNGLLGIVAESNEEPSQQVVALLRKYDTRSAKLEHTCKNHGP